MSSVLSYKFPRVDPLVSANGTQWKQVIPMNGQIFRSDQAASITFNISSNSEFISTVKSFLTGTITAYTSANALATGQLSSWQGISRCFSRVIVRFGGQIIEDLASYNDLVGLYYSTRTTGAQNLLNFTEGFGNTSAVTSGAMKFAHPIMSSLFVTPQLLPTPLCSQGGGGISLEFYLAPASQVFYASGSTVSYYTLSNLGFRYLAVTPDPSYTLALKSSVASGSSCFIPFQRTHVTSTNGNGSTQQVINIAVGQTRSIVSVDVAMYDGTATNVDPYIRYGSQTLTSWKLLADDIPQPSIGDIDYSINTSPESVMIMLASQFGNIYQAGDNASLSSATDFRDHLARISLNFQAMSGSEDVFGSGLSTLGASSPFITLTTQHSSNVSTNVRIMSIWVNDALLEFRASQVSVAEVF